MGAEAAIYIQIYCVSQEQTKQEKHVRGRAEAYRRGRTERRSRIGRTEEEVKQVTKQPQYERCYTLGARMEI